MNLVLHIRFRFHWLIKLTWFFHSRIFPTEQFGAAAGWSLRPTIADGGNGCSPIQVLLLIFKIFIYFIYLFILFFFFFCRSHLALPQNRWTWLCCLGLQKWCEENSTKRVMWNAVWYSKLSIQFEKYSFPEQCFLSPFARTQIQHTFAEKGKTILSFPFYFSSQKVQHPFI